MHFCFLKPFACVCTDSLIVPQAPAYAVQRTSIAEASWHIHPSRKVPELWRRDRLWRRRQRGEAAAVAEADGGSQVAAAQGRGEPGRRRLSAA